MQEKITSILKNEKLHIPVLICFGMIFFLPNLGTVHLFDWDEINFAEAAREMIITKDFMRVKINFHPFWEKPPLFFWLQVISMSIFGITEFAARFVNALCGIITLVIVYSIGKRHYDASFGILWALAILGSFFPHMFYKSGIIDPVFNLFIVLGLTQLSHTTVDPSYSKSSRYIWGGIFIGLAIMTKGPVAFLIVCLCFITFWIFNRFKSIIQIKHILIFSGVVFIVNFFFYGIETLLHGTWFIEEFIKYHIRLLTTGDASHGRPIYYHSVVVLVGCFPASILALRYLFKKPCDGTDIQKNYNKWMLILFWVVIILFSLVKTKTVLYSSLSYFPVTFFAALHVWVLINNKQILSKIDTIFLISFLVLISLIFILFPILMVHREWIATMIKDKLTRAMILKPGDWHYGLSFYGMIYLVILSICIQIIKRKKSYAGFISLFLSSAIGISVFMTVYVGRIENHSQGSMIEFYKELAGKNCYVTSMFKSYAGFFYSKKQPLKNKNGYDKEWLLTGPIDKPAYFVQKAHRADRMVEKYGLIKVKSEGGYTLLLRNRILSNPQM